MERLTYDLCIGDEHCWQVNGVDNLLCKEVCTNQGDKGCKDCPIKAAFDRLAAYEDTGLEPEKIITGEELAEIASNLLELLQYQALGTVEELSTLAKSRVEAEAALQKGGPNETHPV